MEIEAIQKVQGGGGRDSLGRPGGLVVGVCALPLRVGVWQSPELLPPHLNACLQLLYVLFARIRPQPKQTKTNNNLARGSSIRINCASSGQEYGPHPRTTRGSRPRSLCCCNIYIYIYWNGHLMVPTYIYIYVYIFF